MSDRSHTNQGLRQLVKQCHAAFERAENTDYYDAHDYLTARRKFVKFCLLHEAAPAS